MRKKVKKVQGRASGRVKPVKAWVIAEYGRRPFLFDGTCSTRLQCITQFCRDIDTRRLNLPGYFSRVLDPRTKKEWQRHKRLGRRYVRVTITQDPRK